MAYTTRTGQTVQKHDLDKRTFAFAKRVREFVQKLPKTVANLEDIRQLVRASGSIAANYIEANEALSTKNFVMRLKISRKESKESLLWLGLINTGNNTLLEGERRELSTEAKEFLLIFSTILRKREDR